MKTRKNKKMLVVVAMVLMIGLVAGMGAMTYSKYMTKYDTPQQTATAAKWGFVVSADTANLFGTDYSGDGLATVTTPTGVAVHASTSAKIVAPGTTGYMSFTVTGEAEVLAKVVISCSLAANISVGAYTPIKWTLKNDGADVVGCVDVELSAINAYLALNAEYIAPGGDLTSKYTIHWEWALETGATADDIKTNNVYDTAIGFKVANKDYNSVKDLYVGEKTIGSVVTSTAWESIKTTLTFSASLSIEQAQVIPVTP